MESLRYGYKTGWTVDEHRSTVWESTHLLLPTPHSRVIASERIMLRAHDDDASLRAAESIELTPQSETGDENSSARASRIDKTPVSSQY